jgi:oligosaccharide translocation protein RFT1
MEKADPEFPLKDLIEAPKSDAILAKSAQGATFLILLQIVSRALTFVVNQVLLRYLSLEILGISTQLELFSISVLYFARDSLRVALQRQRAYNEPQGSDGGSVGDGRESPVKVARSYGPARRVQEVVNLSYLAVGLGLPLTYIFAKLYIRSASPEVLQTPYLQEALSIYALATALELLNEPSFAIAQQQMLYGARASAETFATSTRCLVTCGTAIWASRTSFGALPFALGQLSYAVVLNLVYFLKISPLRNKTGFSIFLKSLPHHPQYFLSRFSVPLLTLSLNLYAQSAFKHLLTTGDSLLVATLTSLPSQGAYALASNYGSLLARILFQPLEESSRSLFGRLLPSSSVNPTDQTRANLNQATSYLGCLLHFYALLSLVSTSLGPTLAPLLLRTIAGSRWTNTPAPLVLAAYCYYIPLLALNGILEAFVSAVASPAQLRQQSAWMFAFSATFATTGFFVLKVWDLGARGLVLANAVNMALRIWWSWRFVQAYLSATSVVFRIRDMAPASGSVIAAAAAAWGSRAIAKRFDGGWMDLILWASVAIGYGVIM